MTEILNWKQSFENVLRDHPSQDGSHDISHFQRVWKWADQFSGDRGDKLVILAACYFHDIVSYPKNDPRRSRSSVDAAAKATQILSGLDFPSDKLDLVKHCIEAHSFSAGIQTLTFEAEAVQDADRIEALGAIGLARVFYVAGLMGSRLFDSEDPFAEKRSLNDKIFAVDHFREKLLKLPATMKTPRGKIEAEKRADVLKRFLEDLRSELLT